MKDRNILEVLRLARIMEDKELSKEEKKRQLKMVRDNGDITPEEALEIWLEYFG